MTWSHADTLRTQDMYRRLGLNISAPGHKHIHRIWVNIQRVLDKTVDKHQLTVMAGVVVKQPRFCNCLSSETSINVPEYRVGLVVGLYQSRPNIVYV